MKYFNLLLVLFSMTLVVSCSSDDDCLAVDWIGTFVLDPSTEDCSSESVTLNSEVVIVAGAESNFIDFDGVEIEVKGCDLTVTDPIFGLSLDAKLDGDQIKVDGLGCKGTYIRQ